MRRGRDVLCLGRASAWIGECPSSFDPKKEWCEPLQ